ncbi:MAG: acetyl-CoA hydrolase, partial [Syntrophales bacterium LBB04]|nr:acetyl-CoA hydrolase [Syntrophales bacterium LBB04]
MKSETTSLEYWKKKYPKKFASEDIIFGHINRGDTIFIGSACAEPQYLVQGLIRYVESKPHAFFDAEIIHVRTLGVAPYTEKKFKQNFRHNSFFIGNTTRDAVNTGQADYTPILLSRLPSLFHRGLVHVDVALIQTSLPDSHGHLSLGVSLDIVKAAVENASCVVAQVNDQMPRVHGDSFINIDDIDFLLPHNEPLLEYTPQSNMEINHKIGKNIARLIEDGDTIQVGYGKTRPAEYEAAPKDL